MINLPYTATKLIEAADAALSDLRWRVGPLIPPPEMMKVTYELRDDMGPRAGLATRVETGKYVVQFNLHVLLRLSRAGQVELLHHELAHVVDDATFGWSSDVHGCTWRAIMTLMGYPNPSVLHHVDVTDLVGRAGVKMRPATCVSCGHHVATNESLQVKCEACRQAPQETSAGLLSLGCESVIPTYDGRDGFRLVERSHVKDARRIGTGHQPDHRQRDRVCVSG